MYRINIKNDGIYHNVKPGYRYIFTKRQTKKFFKELVINWKCDVEVEKFIYVGNGIFCWSDVFSEEDWLRLLKNV